MTSAGWKAHLDTITNITVVATCVVILGAVGLQRYESARQERDAVKELPHVYPIGVQLKASTEATYDVSDRTILVGLSPTCKYCEASMPAFQRLNEFVKTQRASTVRVLALGSQTQDSIATYLGQRRLTMFLPVQVSATSQLRLSLLRTPSVTIVDRAGTVLATWPGLMTDDRINEVIEQVRPVATQ